MRGVVAIAIGFSFVPSVSRAFRPPTHLDDHAAIDVAAGSPVRAQPRLSSAVPAAAQHAFDAFIARHGAWRGSWDLDRGVPSRLYGPGIAAPGSSASPKVAEDAARALLFAHLDLLAPGASARDFELASNHVDATGLRTIGLRQRHRGAPVLGGQISARIRNDRIFVIASEAIPSIDASLPTRRPRGLERTAAKWIEDDFGSATEVTRVAGPFVLPLIRAGGAITHHGVFEVEVGAERPVGRWLVWIDGAGAPVARRQTLMFGAGTVRFNAPERRPDGTRLDWAAPFAELSIGGQTVHTDADGNFMFAGTDPIDGIARARGLEAYVSNDAGPEDTVPFTLADGQTFTWNMQDDELVDAQINGFIAANHAKNRAKVIAPDMAWLSNEAVQVTVNINDQCNAYSDGTTINFFRASQQCQNTGRLADVVYHEFGHSFHAHAIIPGVGNFDTALSEGGSDYFAATTTNDPGMGRGFFYTDRALRHLDEANGEAVWPDDIGEPHITGIIFGGAMWDLRKSLVVSMGEQAGVAYTDQLFYAVFQRAVDIPSSYVEVLTADDDDGDLTNGTPNQCAINDAFGRHGLADVEMIGPPLGKPSIEGMVVHLPLGMRTIECPGQGIVEATLEWRLRSDPGVGGMLTLGAVTGGFAAEIPAQRPGQVVEYQLRVTTEAGDLIPFPDNRASPWYELFVGEVIPIFCSDFETEASQSGFAHELLAGENREGADDWQWGVPQGTTGSGDPSLAHSGQRVYGNDLGGGNYNGRYQPGRQNVLHAPVVDVTGYTNVRLHYRRWLNVEDGNFDKAEILSNGTVVWANLDTGDGGNTHHEDKEWRFQDVDLSSSIVDGKVAIDFRLTSDGGLEFGGWTVDDICIVAFDDGAPRCGDGNVDPGETCDDGNLAAQDGCENDCTPTPIPAACGDGKVDPGEACDDGNVTDGDGCDASCVPTPVIMDPGQCPAGGCAMEGPGLIQDEGGCGCGAARHRSSALPILFVIVIGALLLRRRR